MHASPWFAFICQQVGLKVKLSFFRNECAHSACSGIQSTRHFIELVVVKTKQIVNSNSNVISMRQTCGQRSSMAAASKHRGLACYFSVRICYKFLFSLQVPKSWTDLDPTLLYIPISGTYSKFVRKIKMLALGVCLPQPCPSAGRRFPRQDHVWMTIDNLFRFHKNEFDEMPCKFNSTQYARSFQIKTNPALI